jgi:hypothetical protein
MLRFSAIIALIGVFIIFSLYSLVDGVILDSLTNVRMNEFVSTLKDLPLDKSMNQEVDNTKKTTTFYYFFEKGTYYSSSGQDIGNLASNALINLDIGINLNDYHINKYWILNIKKYLDNNDIKMICGSDSSSPRDCGCSDVSVGLYVSNDYNDQSYVEDKGSKFAWLVDTYICQTVDFMKVFGFEIPGENQDEHWRNVRVIKLFYGDAKQQNNDRYRDSKQSIVIQHIIMQSISKQFEPQSLPTTTVYLSTFTWPPSIKEKYDRYGNDLDDSDHDDDTLSETHQYKPHAYSELSEEEIQLVKVLKIHF